MKRGYFEIGVFHGKTEFNLGTLFRSAYQLGAAGLFLIGPRFKPQCTDTYKAYRHIPLRVFTTFEEFQEARPYDAMLVGVEMGGASLSSFCHPQRAIYLLGAEDHGLTPSVLNACQTVVSLDAVGPASYNVAVAGSIIMYHRRFMS